MNDKFPLSFKLYCDRTIVFELLVSRFSREHHKRMHTMIYEHIQVSNLLGLGPAHLNKTTDLHKFGNPYGMVFGERRRMTIH